MSLFISIVFNIATIQKKNLNKNNESPSHMNFTLHLVCYFFTLSNLWNKNKFNYAVLSRMLVAFPGRHP